MMCTQWVCDAREAQERWPGFRFHSADPNVSILPSCSRPPDASAALQVRALKDYCNNYDLTSLNIKAGDVITVKPSWKHAAIETHTHTHTRFINSSDIARVTTGHNWIASLLRDAFKGGLKRNNRLRKSPAILSEM